MDTRRIDMHRLQELVRLHRLGTPAREVARLLGMGPNTERQYRTALADGGLLAGEASALPELEVLKSVVAERLPRRTPPAQVSTVEPWTDAIRVMAGRRAGPRAIWDALRLENPEFVGSLSAVKRVCARLRLHAEAFAWFGGVPQVIVPDNLKAAVVRAAFGVSRDAALHRSYRELARHYDFRVDPTPPRDPGKKGKVESGVKYVKRSYFLPREFADSEEAQRGLNRWVIEIAGSRTHGTTGRRPMEVFEQEERARLLPLPALGYVPVEWKKAKVHTDGHVQFDRRLYSVPWPHIGSEVWVQATPDSVVIYRSDERVATHDRRGSGPRSTHDGHLPEHRAPWRHRSREYWLRRAAGMGDGVRAYMEEVLETDRVLDRIRTVQAMVIHLETFPSDRARNACERASYWGLHDYRGLKDILAKALDLQPLPPALFPAPTWTSPPRFARTAAELIHPPPGDPT